jgi:hypothetical protein
MGKLLSGLAAILVLGSVASAQTQETDARAVIEKAVKAMGGLEKLAMKAASHRKSKGTFHTDGYTFTGESFSQPGGKRRINLRGNVRDTHQTRTLVMESDSKGWISYDGATYDLDPAFLDRIKKSAYADKVCGLVTLLQDKGYTLTLLGETQVKGTATLGVKVQAEGKPDVSLYFDKATGLLLKSANRVTEPNTDKEVLQEVYYSDYRLYDPALADEQMLHDAKVGVTVPALLAFLRKQSPDAKEQLEIKDLVAKLGHKSFSVRQKATVALQAIGARAAPLLRLAARDKDLEMSRRAEQLLEKIGRNAEQALSAAVVRLLAARRPAGAAEALLDYFPWAPDDAVAREVQGALVTLAADPREKAALEKALASRDGQRRAAATAALGKDGGKFLEQPWRRLPVSGVRLPMRSALYREGQHFMDLETTEVHFYNRLDDSLFTRP